MTTPMIQLFYNVLHYIIGGVILKRIMYFVGVCILCITIVTGCTNNETEPKNEQKVTNLAEETVEDIIEQKENDVAVEVKGEYFIINKELFKDEFNFIASNIQIT